MGSSWDPFTFSGNPICSPELERYLRAVQLEQSKSHVVQKQAKPLFLDKLRSISAQIKDMLKESHLKASDRYILLRDQAFFKVQYFSGDRANVLWLCLSQEVKQFLKGNGLLFSHTVDKTLGKGKLNEFCLSRIKNS